MIDKFSPVILAGGRGTRMGESPDSKPKYLLEVGGKTLLLRHIEQLDSCGFTDVTILVNEKSEIVAEYVKKIGDEFKIRIKLLKDKEIYGTAGALFGFLDSAKKKHFLVIYADTVHNLDLVSLMNFHISKDSDFTSVVHPNVHPADSDQVVFDGDNRIIQIYPKTTEKPVDLRNFCLAAMFCINATLLTHLRSKHDQKPGRVIDFTKDILPKLDFTDKNCYVYLTSEYIKDAGTPIRLEQVSRELSGSFAFRREFRPAVFFDRDGTLIHERGYITDPNQVELIQGAAKLVRALNALGVLCILVTNQPVVARGECTPSQLERIHGRLERLLVNSGAFLDSIYYCPHHPDSGFLGEIVELKIECNCRKPKVGLLKRASIEHKFDPSLSWFIGNSHIDELTARNFGLGYLHVDPVVTLDQIQAEKLFRDFEKILRKSFE